ncbi:MAG: undecaprenyl-diphosphate phosphatase [Myxococcota bacterium]
MAWWQAVVLGLVEGITEYLPVSSTGHLILASSVLGLDGSSIDTFNIVVQGGAILAVLGLYGPRVRQMLMGLVGRDPVGLRLAINLVVAFLPAAVLGLLLNDLIEAWLFSVWPVLFALSVGGLWMIWLDRRAEPAEPLQIDQLTPLQAVGIGFFQCVAMWPGTSRSMMTIAGGRMLGLPAAQAAEFSFLLGLPTLGAACVYSLLKNLKGAHDTGGLNLFQELGVTPVLIGIAVATVSAVLAVRWLVSFLTRHGLAPFGYYRLVLTVVLLIAWVVGFVTIG